MLVKFQDVFLLAIEDVQKRIEASGDSKKLKLLKNTQFAFEMAPLNEKKYWQKPSVTLCKYYPKTLGSPSRFIVYRMPIERRCSTKSSLYTMLCDIIFQWIQKS